MSTKHNIYGSLNVRDNITGSTLTLSSITNDNSLTQILARDDSTGLVEYRDVTSIITGATSGITTITASNGLTKSNDNVTLGGILTGNTNIDNNGFILSSESFSASTLSAQTVYVNSGNVFMDNSFGVNIGTNIIDGGSGFFGPVNYLQMRTASDYSEPWFFMNADGGTAFGSFIQFALGQTSTDIGVTFMKPSQNVTQINNNHLAVYDNSGLYSINNTYARESVVGFFAAEGTATSAVTGSVAIATSAVTMTDNYTLYTDKINLIDTPINDNSLTQILARDDSTGLVEYRDVSSIIGAASGDTFVVSGNADVATSQLTFTYNTGGTFTVANSAALFADNDINVTGGTYNPVTGCVTFATNSGTTFDVCGFVTGITDTYVTGGTYNSSTDTIDLTRTDLGTVSITGISVGDITRVQPGTNINTGGTENNPVVNLDDDISLNSVSANTISGGTIYSGSTDLYDIFLTTADGNDITRVQDGINTFTGGTGNNPTINVTALTIDNITVSGDSSFDSVSATTIYSGSTNLSDIFATKSEDSFSTGGTVTQQATSASTEVTIQIDGNNSFSSYSITGLTDTFVSGFTYSANTFTISQNDGSSLDAEIDTIDLASVLSAVTFDIGTTGSISATTFYSGSTDLSDIFLTEADGNDITRVQPGVNINTGGTANNPVVNLDDDISLNSVSANTISGGTIYSGSTNLYDIFLTTADGNDITRVQDGINTFTGGTGNNPTVNITGLTIDNINVSGDSEFVSISATTIYSGSTDLSNLFVTEDTFVTGFTYNDANVLTINSNDGSDYSVTVNTMTGLTINGESSGTTFTVNGQSVFSGQSTDVVQIYGSGSTSPIFRVQGSSGELFSITDSLTGSLFAVNDISGLPILEVFDDDTIHMGSYQAPSLNTTVLLNLGVGLSTVYSIPMSAYTGAWFEYTVSNTVGARAGQIMSIFSGNTANITETTTTDIGSTDDVTFSMSANSTNALLQVSAATSGWEVKTIVRSI